MPEVVRTIDWCPLFNQEEAEFYRRRIYTALGVPEKFNEIPKPELLTRYQILNRED